MRKLSDEEKEDGARARKIRNIVDLSASVLYQDPGLTLVSAFRLVEGTRRIVLRILPEKELLYEMVYQSRLERILIERYGERARIIIMERRGERRKRLKMERVFTVH